MAVHASEGWTSAGIRKKEPGGTTGRAFLFRAGAPTFAEETGGSALRSRVDRSERDTQAHGQRVCLGRLGEGGCEVMDLCRVKAKNISIDGMNKLWDIWLCISRSLGQSVKRRRLPPAQRFERSLVYESSMDWGGGVSARGLRRFGYPMDQSIWQKFTGTKRQQ
jgi:hypothetical protein